MSNNDLNNKNNLFLPALAIYIGTALLTINQRIGWQQGDIRILSIVLRSEIWFTIAIVIYALYYRKVSSTPQRLNYVAKSLLLNKPILFLFTTLLASYIAGIRTGFFLNPFGVFDFFEVILCTSTGYLIFKLTITVRNFGHRIIKIFLWSPLLNIFAGLLSLLLGINNIEGFNGVDDFGSGFIGLGERFQGVASNPNIVLTQTSIAFSFLIPRLIYLSSSSVASKKINYALYGSCLIAIMLWTGTRSGLVILPTILLVFIWIKSKVDKKIHTLFLNFFLVIIFSILAGLLVHSLGFGKVLFERLDSEGRLPLWNYYIELLLKNPLGLGLGFESIVGTDTLIEGQRLPPHNFLLTAGMYGGFAAIIVTLMQLWNIRRVISRILVSIKSWRESTNMIGVILALCASVISIFFSGLLQGQFNVSILTGLLLGLATCNDVDLTMSSILKTFIDKKS